jgi:hypothetical protein
MYLTRPALSTAYIRTRTGTRFVTNATWMIIEQLATPTFAAKFGRLWIHGFHFKLKI